MDSSGYNSTDPRLQTPPDRVPEPEITPGAPVEIPQGPPLEIPEPPPLEIPQQQPPEIS